MFSLGTRSANGTGLARQKTIVSSRRQSRETRAFMVPTGASAKTSTEIILSWDTVRQYRISIWAWPSLSQMIWEIKKVAKERLWFFLSARASNRNFDNEFEPGIARLFLSLISLQSEGLGGRRG